jgi:hypothetical protein
MIRGLGGGGSQVQPHKDEMDLACNRQYTCRLAGWSIVEEVGEGGLCSDADLLVVSSE